MPKNAMNLFSKVLARSEEIFRRNSERRRKSAQAEAVSGQTQARPTVNASETATTATEWTGSMSGPEEAPPTTTTGPGPGGTLETRPNTAPATPGVRLRHIRKVREGSPSRRSDIGGGGGGGSSPAASCSDKHGPRKRLLAYIRQINPPLIPAPTQGAPSGATGGDFVGGEGKRVETIGAPSSTAKGEVIGGEGKRVAVTDTAVSVAVSVAVGMGAGTERTGTGAKRAAMRAARWRRREREEEDARIQAR